MFEFKMQKTLRIVSFYKRMLTFFHEFNLNLDKDNL